MDSIQGRALVASPYLTDVNFLRSVVYILQHDEDGAIGLVLNRPTHTTIGNLISQLLDRSIDDPRPVFCGGPVDGPMMLLQAHLSADGQSRTLLLASDEARVLELLAPEDPSDPALGEARLFEDYAGWAGGQLDEELRCGGWLLWDIQPEHIFGDPVKLWQTAVRQIGRDILAGGIDPAKMPEDPAFN